MKKIINTAPPVVITTTRAPLVTSMSLTSVGGEPLTQLQDTAQNAWSPDRTKTVLVLYPVINIKDPDTGLAVDPSSADIKYYVNNFNTPVTSRTTSDDYYLETKDVVQSGETVKVPTGRLVVRKNVDYDNAVVIMCQAEYTDASRSEIYKMEASVMLTSDNKPDELISIHLQNPSLVTYWPMTDTDSKRTFKAIAYKGSTKMDPSKVKFFWYLDEVLIPTNGTVPAYVSGQNTDTLVLDADFADNVKITASLALDTTATAPDYPAKAECALVWKWPRLEALPYSKGGAAVKSKSGELTFGAFIQGNSKDVDEDKAREYCRLNWKKRTTASTAVTDLGWSEEVSVKNADLYQTGNVNVNIYPELNTLGPYEVLTDDSGNIITDDSGSSTASDYAGQVVGRV